MSLNATSKEVVSSILNANYDYLSKICHPLFKSTPIKYVDYIRYYDNGEAIAFTMSPDFSVKTVQENLLPTFEEFQLFSLFNQKACFLSVATSLPPGIGEVSHEKYERNLAYSLDHGVYHRLYLVERYEGYYVTCGFGVTNDNKSMINYYLNALPNLEKFLKYFELHSKEYIDSQLEYSKFNLPTYHDKLIMDIVEFELPLPANKEFDLITVDPFSEITPREKECMSLIALGYTMKSTAIKLGISHRTVEQHLRNLKDKLGLNTKSQLVELWHTYLG